MLVNEASYCEERAVRGGESNHIQQIIARNVVITSSLSIVFICMVEAQFGK